SKIPGNAFELPLASNATSTPHPHVSLSTSADSDADLILRNNSWITASDVQLLLGQIRHNDSPRTSCKSSQGSHNSDRATANYERGIAGLDSGLRRRLHPYSERFHHGSLGKADGIREPEGEGRRMHNLGSEAAVDRGRRPESHLRIHVIDSQAARFRKRIRNTWFHAYPIPWLQIPHSRAYLKHGTGRFMSQHHGRLHHKGADPTVGIVVDIASADAHPLHLDPHI